MRRVVIALLAVAFAFTAGAAKKEAKQDAPPAAAGKAKPKKDPAELIVGQLVKEKDGKEPYFVLPKEGGDKINVPVAAAKRMYVNLDDYVGKRVAISCNQDETTKAIKSIIWVKTEAEYKKMGGGK